MRPHVTSTLPIVLSCLFINAAVAQGHPETPSGGSARAGRQPEPQAATQQAVPEPAAQPLYQLRPGLYVRPAPYSPDYWSPLVRPYPDYSQRGRSVSSRRRRAAPWRGNRSYRSPRYDGLGLYGYGYAYLGGDPWAAYEQGRHDADHQYVWFIASQRAGRLLNQYRVLFDEAIILFRDGRYDWAAIKLLGAAEKNHANAASRLHAGHALFAMGKYDEAVKLIARAFELSPSLAHKQYDIRDEYGDRADFDEQRDRLKSYIGLHPNDAAALTLLGYVTFHSEGPGASYPYFKRAARLDPGNYFIPKLLESARFSRGMTNHPPTPTQQNPPRATQYRDAARAPTIHRVSAPLTN